MENRRPTGKPPENSLNRTGSYKKTGDNSQEQRKSYHPRSDRPRHDRFQSARDNNSRNERFSTRGDGKSQPRAPNPVQARDNRYSKRDNNFDSLSENRPDNRTEKFAPRRNFIPRGVKPAAQHKIIEKPKIYDEMQVTDGKHIGKFMKATESPRVRPTARRVRETLFKLIFRCVRAGRFLDLCAGSGAVGIEAISRGALICSFVERSAKMCAIIKKNLETIGIKTGHGEVFEIEAVPFLKQMEKRRRHWDVVFFDPPYDTNYDEVLSYLSRGVSIKSGGMLVIEHHAEMFFPEKVGILTRRRVVAVGETSLSFYERK